jgi:hypothetical protein
MMIFDFLPIFIYIWSSKKRLMKYILSALFFGFIFITATIAAVSGLVMMANAVLDHTSLIPGFHCFALGSILFLVTASSYMITQILASAKITSVLVSNLTELILSRNQAQNPFSALINGLQGHIQMGEVNLDGTVTPLGGSRNDLISRFFGQPGQPPKKLEELSIEELEAKRKEFIDTQRFEEAAAVRDLIAEKKKGQ